MVWKNTRDTILLLPCRHVMRGFTVHAWKHARDQGHFSIVGLVSGLLGQSSGSR